jgi:hypothetical protein
MLVFTQEQIQIQESLKLRKWKVNFQKILKFNQEHLGNTQISFAPLNFVVTLSLALLPDARRVCPQIFWGQNPNWENFSIFSKLNFYGQEW